MTIDYSRTTPAPAPKWAHHLGVLILRVATGGSLIAWHCAPKAMAGWAHIWDKTPWPFPDELANMGFPMALPLAISLVVITLLGSIFIILGLLTRPMAFVLAVFSIVTALLYHSYPTTAPMAVLYAGSFLAIALCGPGLFACDRALRALSQRRA